MELLLEIMNKIPTEFSLQGHPIKVNMYDEIENGLFGDYDCAKEVIRIAKNIRRDSELIPLNETQIMASFIHEFIHALQWHSGHEFSEIEAQTYSGMIIEFLNTRKYE